MHNRRSHNFIILIHMNIRRKPSLAQLSRCFMPSSTSKHHIDYNKKEIKELFANPTPELFDLSPLVSCIHAKNNKQFAQLLETLQKYNTRVEEMIQNDHTTIEKDSMMADKKKMACLKFVYLQMIKMVSMNVQEMKVCKIAKNLQEWYFSVFQKHASIFYRHFFKTKQHNTGVEEERIRQSFQTNPAKHLYDYRRKKLCPSSSSFDMQISLSSDIASPDEFPKHLYSKLYWREQELLRSIREQKGQQAKIKQIKIARQKRRNAALKKVLTCTRQSIHLENPKEHKLNTEKENEFDSKKQEAFYITEQSTVCGQNIKKTNFSSHSSMAMTLNTFKNDQIPHISYPKLPSVSLASHKTQYKLQL